MRTRDILFLSLFSLAALLVAGGAEASLSSQSAPQADPKQAQGGTAVPLPRVGSGTGDLYPESEDKDLFVVTVAAPGALYIGKESVELAAVKDRAGKLKDPSPPGRIAYLRCNKLLKFGDLEPVLQALVDGGIDRVRMVVESKPEGEDRTYLTVLETRLSGKAEREWPDVLRDATLDKRFEVRQGDGEMKLDALKSYLEIGYSLEYLILAASDISYADIVAVMDQVTAAYRTPILPLFGFLRQPPGTLAVASLLSEDKLPPAEYRKAIASVPLGDVRSLRGPAPTYPPLAKAARIYGAVVVRVLVNEKGKVVWAWAAAGHPLLQDAAVSAARQAIFAPLRRDGKPIPFSTTLTYNFTL